MLASKESVNTRAFLTTEARLCHSKSTPNTGGGPSGKDMYTHVVYIYMHIHTCIYVHIYMHICVNKPFISCHTLGLKS